MGRAKEMANSMREKMFSPAYICIMIVLTIIIGNFCRWSDAAYGTHFDVINPLLVLLTVVLFATYIYGIWSKQKGK